MIEQFDRNPTFYRQLDVDGIRIAFREAGTNNSSKLVLLHGFPSSSHQYRDLIPRLANRFHVIAPDYPGFGYSDTPDPATFRYSFEVLSDVIEKFLTIKGFDRFGLYAHDYGAPVGLRIVGRRPEILEWLIVQNCSCYEEGLSPAWSKFRELWKNRTAQTEKAVSANFTLESIKNFYLHGTADPERVGPDNWTSDFGFMERTHSVRLNLDLLYDYRTNIDMYPRWQEFLREHQPKTLIFWGDNDVFLLPVGGQAYLRDLPEAQMHRLKTGHFALEEKLDYIAYHILRFYSESVLSSSPSSNSRSDLIPIP